MTGATHVVVEKNHSYNLAISDKYDKIQLNLLEVTGHNLVSWRL